MGIVVKICGITRVEDAQIACEAGCDFVGLNFVPGTPRFIAPDVGNDIVAHLDSGVRSVGVFWKPSAPFVQSILDSVELDVLQFSGPESPDFCSRFDRPYIKTLRVDAEFCYDRLAAEYQDAWVHLIDSFVKAVPGGSGVSFDWNVWPKKSSFPLMLAGGLNPDNVGEAIAKTQPWGVDVASGVESSDPRRKDPDLVRKFVCEARGADV